MNVYVFLVTVGESHEIETGFSPRVTGINCGLVQSEHKMAMSIKVFIAN